MASQIERRLSHIEYSDKICIEAIRGERLPEALGLPVVQHSVIRGIRYHDGFAEELMGSLPAFTRALCARSIMSNRVPQINQPEDIPYCIWHPDVATEATYREVARRYPQMKYQVGRACAVAGYFNLYMELNLLPEVHIADEARENGHSDIYEDIMASPVKYEVMNDYFRTINADQPKVAHLNGNTAVRPYLEVKRKFRQTDEPFDVKGTASKGHYFDITEDNGVDEFDTKSLPSDGAAVTQYLYSPLPRDLPLINKDVLILTAAYYGDIDRYARLCRPMTVPTEIHCIVRGIYHNTMFAKWWSLQPDISDYRIQRAIYARFIMDNDISRITPETPCNELPYLIWYPAIAHWRVYQELVRRKPSMKAAVARACIVADYRDVYDKLDVDPDVDLLAEAKVSPNPYYLQDLRNKTERRGGVPDEWPKWNPCYTRDRLFEHTTTRLLGDVSNSIADTESGVPYNGVYAGMSHVALHVCASEGQDMHDVDLSDMY
ncbi:hypothetical protein AFLA70_13g006030 [Aspergillus flavus AF70]|nr:hypothetical protein AFLA70_13g006030 [Aspergillus flavus AF70]